MGRSIDKKKILQKARRLERKAEKLLLLSDFYLGPIGLYETAWKLYEEAGDIKSAERCRRKYGDLSDALWD